MQNDNDERPAGALPDATSNLKGDQMHDNVRTAGKVMPGVTMTPVTSGDSGMGQVRPQGLVVPPSSSIYPQPEAAVQPASPQRLPTANTPYLQPKPRRRLSLKTTLVGAIIFVMLLGSTAAGYYGVIVPNKPENVVLSALVGMFNQPQTVMDAKLDYKDKKQSFGIAADMTMEADRTNGQFKVAGSLGLGGTRYDFDIRMYEQSLYFKAGGLAALGDIAAVVDPSYSSLLQQVDNQWYVLDRSFWNSLGSEVSCIGDLSLVLNDQDVDLLKKAYEKYPLFDVTKVGSEDMSGTAVTKYKLVETTEETYNSFVNELQQLSIVESIKACAEKSGNEIALDEELDAFTSDESLNETGEIYLYIDKDKKARKLTLTSVDDSAGEVTLTLEPQERAPDIQKPDGVKPLQDLVNSFFGQYLGSFGGTVSPLGTYAQDTIDTNRKNLANSAHQALEVYFNDYGKYPASLSEAGIEASQRADSTGQALEYQPSEDLQSYGLSIRLENYYDPSAIEGIYRLKSIN